MADIPIPFTNQEVDTDDGASGILMTVAVMVVGFGLFAMAQDAGQNLYGKASGIVAQLTGMNLDGSDTNSPEVV
jgi:hypothetical protein